MIACESCQAAVLGVLVELRKTLSTEIAQMRAKKGRSGVARSPTNRYDKDVVDEGIRTFVARFTPVRTAPLIRWLQSTGELPLTASSGKEYAALRRWINFRMRALGWVACGGTGPGAYWGRGTHVSSEASKGGEAAADDGGAPAPDGG